MMTTFEPIWISTDAQMQVLNTAYNSASLLTKLIGRYDIPDTAASLRGGLWMRLPLVFIAEGGLTFSEDALLFEPKPHRAFGWRVYAPVMKMFDLPFTRVCTSKQPPLDNFLVCVGCRISMSEIHSRSCELRARLLEWRG
jgi:hypothetical protein